MHSFWMRIGVIAGIIVLYFFGIRPFRAQVNHAIYLPVIAKTAQANSNIEISGESSTVGNTLYWESEEGRKSLFVKVPFGLHFLLAVIGLIFLQAKKRYYHILFLIHFSGGIFSLLIVYLSGYVEFGLLIGADLMMRYLVPLCSLGIVPLALIEKKRKIDE